MVNVPAVLLRVKSYCERGIDSAEARSLTVTRKRQGHVRTVLLVHGQVVGTQYCDVLLPDTRGGFKHLIIC